MSSAVETEKFQEQKESQWMNSKAIQVGDQQRYRYKSDIITKNIKRNKAVEQIPIWKLLLDNRNPGQGNSPLQ